MKTLRQGIHNGELQNNLTGNGFNIVDVTAVGNVTGKTVIVDDAIASDSIGEISTGLPFKTLAAALAAINIYRHANPDDAVGFLLVMRPGTYAFDGLQEINVPNLTISAYGAIITSLTMVNEQSKLTITAGSVTIRGLELAGAVNAAVLPDGFDATDALAGAIEANHGTYLTLKDCYIHAWAGAGIYGSSGYGGLKVHDCRIDACQNGILAKTVDTQNVTNINLSRNSITLARRNGIVGVGSNNSSTQKALSNLVILDNVLAQNNSTTQTDAAAINLSGFVVDAQIIGNYIQGSDGLKISQCLRGLIANNDIWNATNPIQFIGCQQIECATNQIDGHNASGTTITATAISITGFYLAAGDAGPYNIVGNTVFGLGSLRRAVYCVGQASVLIASNRLHGLVFIQDSNNVQVKGNTVVLDNNNPCVIVQSSTQDVGGIEISGNRLIAPAGGTYTQLILTATLSTFVISSMFVVDNTSVLDRIYTSKVINSTGTPPGLITSGNSPKTTVRSGLSWDYTRGWVNDEMVFNQCDQFDVPTSSVYGFSFGGTKVVGQRRTGWAGSTGTVDRTSFNSETATLLQTARHMHALLTDLALHGLIGP